MVLPPLSAVYKHVSVYKHVQAVKPSDLRGIQTQPYLAPYYQLLQVGDG